MENLKNNIECKNRRLISEEISKKCPMELGKEIIITGSVSRGYADENSDIEIEFLVDKMLPEEERIAWIRSIGGTEIRSYGAPIIDGSEWVIFNYQGYFVEAGWQTYSAMESNINDILKLKYCTHDRLLLASSLKDAKTLKDKGIITEIKKKMDIYPEGLEQKIILNTIEPWTVELALKVRKSLARRDDRIPLVQTMVFDIQRIIRILFALNKQWEADWKWTRYTFDNLAIKPPRLNDRINEILGMNNAELSLQECFNLINDTLLLIPEQLELDQTVGKIANNIYKLQL
ncbi:DUF4037 domain-containing protein [Clostridium omnivorum]|uniref:DUF4037 domain-containing protein n=1 Tax=Clostridium omnivorum TaxID=1604902 RepID=A0ABQ5N5A2_9CLOT|nr:DUF4037 domain-containing protein [Clostridium sp. E14]GLC30377.1 hypothetical protein bsdE14_17870 [Clostridium sp. E14]